LPRVAHDGGSRRMLSKRRVRRQRKLLEVGDQETRIARSSPKMESDSRGGRERGKESRATGYAEMEDIRRDPRRDQGEENTRRGDE